jgi:hypothetical protein
MTTKKYQTKIEIDIIPGFHNEYPEIEYGIGDSKESMFVKEKTTLTFDLDLETGEHLLFINFVNKKDEDTVVELNLDKTISIGDIRFEGIAAPHFQWLGEYEPIYPEPWYSQQSTVPDKVIKGTTFMGWNGSWTLKFKSPIFPWMHQEVLHLGWVWPTS